MGQTKVNWKPQVVKTCCFQKGARIRLSMPQLRFLLELRIPRASRKMEDPKAATKTQHSLINK